MNTELLDANQTVNEVVNDVVATDVSTNVVDTPAKGGAFKKVGIGLVLLAAGAVGKTIFDKLWGRHKAKKAAKAAEKNASEDAKESE